MWAIAGGALNLGATYEGSVKGLFFLTLLSL